MKHLNLIHMPTAIHRTVEPIRNQSDFSLGIDTYTRFNRLSNTKPAQDSTSIIQYVRRFFLKENYSNTQYYADIGHALIVEAFTFIATIDEVRKVKLASYGTVIRIEFSDDICVMFRPDSVSLYINSKHSHCFVTQLPKSTINTLYRFFNKELLCKD